MRPASVRACVRSTRGSAREGVPSSDAARGKIGENGRRSDAGDGATRADKKAGKNYFGGSDGAGEKKKYYLGGSEKKILFGRERNKILTSTRTQPTKKLLRTVETSFFYLFLSGVDIDWKELWYNH